MDYPEEYYDISYFELRKNIVEYNKLLHIVINKIKNNQKLELYKDEIKIFLDFGLYDNDKIKKYLLVNEISLESILENIDLYYNLRNINVIYRRSKYQPNIYSTVIMIQELLTEKNILYVINNKKQFNSLKVILEYMDPFFDFSEQNKLLIKHYLK